MAVSEAIDQFVLSVLRDSWEVFRRDALVFVVASVVLLLVSALTLGILAAPLTIGFIEMVRRGRQGEPLALGLLFSRFDAFVPSLVATTLIFLAVFVGMLLLVLPGLVAALFSAFAMHAIAYEHATGVDSIRRSVELVRENFLPALALVLVVAVAHAIGSAVVFGILLTMPMSLIALTVGYERIAGPASVGRVITV